MEVKRKKPPWAAAHQRITKMGALAPRIETCYPQIGCRGRYLFGGIAPRKKLTTVACMHHELLLLFQEARGTNYKQQGCHYPNKGGNMEAILERCCGIDVHKSKLTACLLVGKPNGKAEKNHQDL
ncbi:hypothetical protein M1M94_01190 [Thermodesulfovibrionales bacterium]|nr:hypothetical protein [Thermodesulfovibrionales bacterium]